MWKNIMKSTIIKCLGVKPAVLFISFWLIGMMFVGTANANEPINEGIKVHGHWEITMINPDGSVAQNISFENALSIQGSRQLIVLLTGQGRVAQDTSGDLYWDLMIRVEGVDDTPECNNITGTNFAGPPTSDTAPTRADVTIGGSGWDLTVSRLMLVPDSCVLAETFTINRVMSTRTDIIDEPLEGGSQYFTSLPFTFKDFPEGITVARGQAVSIKATFNFE